MEIPEIDVLEANARLAQDHIMVDVRNQDEFDAERIASSVFIPLPEFAERYQELPKDKPLIMQCRSGARSGKATAFLLENGYSDVVNLAGGILAWREADLPTEPGA